MPMIDRSTLYVTPDGRPMNTQEQLALLLDIGGIDAAEAAALTGATRLSIETYRKPSFKRAVPAAIIMVLEDHVLARLARIAQAAGYELRPRA
ncbi:hypothetical protein BJF92_13665 [Rhizobium rhizosphaerae]|uniref:Uncharacterized protein n=1 Tax=Xaviernesmea rhizosphaerae TaxID=1672749 RepID=A0A1Q9AHX6_9HYPH|nr:hypothetical protein [Xaviernesmea rhizosphaerae]OLP54852.1 hypothetical protein BJF92_13665 [Xaviernesmea rhizosphaerae]